MVSFPVVTGNEWKPRRGYCHAKRIPAVSQHVLPGQYSHDGASCHLVDHSCRLRLVPISDGRSGTMAGTRWICSLLWRPDALLRLVSAAIRGGLCSFGHQSCVESPVG